MRKRGVAIQRVDNIEIDYTDFVRKVGNLDL